MAVCGLQALHWRLGLFRHGMRCVGLPVPPCRSLESLAGPLLPRPQFKRRRVTPSVWNGLDGWISAPGSSLVSNGRVSKAGQTTGDT
eukprot:5495664-Prorocentrum_lima.AAC.1